MQAYKPNVAHPSQTKQLNYYRMLGILSKHVDDLVMATRQGYSVVVIDNLAKRLGATQKEILPYLHITPATLARRRKTGALNPGESDNVYRLASVFKDAVDLFEGDEAAAVTWLKQPAKALDNKSPFSLLDSQAGAEQVRDLIGRLDAGVYT